jgi:DNA helicase II / ATP-dependent DNA helicase PcrA
MNNADPENANPDQAVDDQIFECLDLENPRSFFLYAGAGSGKTRSLIEVLRRLRKKSGEKLTISGRNVGVITYTNAACDEIKQRLNFDTRVVVSTIHSFAWSLINGYNDDIRSWLRENLAEEIAQLEQLQVRGRPGKASDDRARSIVSKNKRLARLDSITRFTYSPTGDNRGRDALNHSEVISMTARFLTEKAGLRSILVNMFPILLIDESQDTNKHLLDAFLSVQAEHKGCFSLGLFGDTMQRIYSDGKVGLADALPDDWARPVKVMNYRCPTRVITLINRIRADVDRQEQQWPANKPEGTVRFFIAPSGHSSKQTVERLVAEQMAATTTDNSWNDRAYHTLILEHHMAASRLGFERFFEPLYKVDKLKTGLLDGTQPGIRFFAKDLLPLVKAIRAKDDFAIAAAVRERSPLLDRKKLLSDTGSQSSLLRKVEDAVKLLTTLINREHADVRFIDILNNVSASELFSIPESLQPFIGGEALGPSEGEVDEDEVDKELGAWREMLETPFSQIEAYDDYISGASGFDTHQGVKGLEFPRVMVIVEEARGFLFSYDKLFGAKDKSATDLKHEAVGEETTLDRTRRLFYVTCSRAEESLAILAYSENPEAVKRTVTANKWFSEQEVSILTREDTFT